MTITDMLMKGNVAEAGKRQTGVFKSRELARICGVDGAVDVEFTALSPRKVYEVRGIMTDREGNPRTDKTVDASLVAILSAVTNIDLKDTQLREKYGCRTPKDLAEKLFGNEIDALAGKILDMSQPDEASDEETVKN